MANLFTYATVENKVLTDMDLLDEDFITSGVGSEMMGICNDAIHWLESKVHDLCQDYFKSYAFIPLVSGTEFYALPTDIYADKIRQIIYTNGPQIYEVLPLWKHTQFIEKELIKLYGSNSLFYKYDLVNTTAAGLQLQLAPVAFETSSTVMKIWYIREAKRVAAMSDVLDFREFTPFIEKYMKYHAALKEPHPLKDDYKAMMEEEQGLVIQTLSDRQPNGHNQVEMDLSHYLEHN